MTNKPPAALLKIMLAGAWAEGQTQDELPTEPGCTICGSKKVSRKWKLQKQLVFRELL